MSNYNQNQAAPQAYPAPGTAYPSGVDGHGQPPQAGAYMVPPPSGYPMKDGQGYHPATTESAPPHQTQSRGDGFWKGCCAALCCCCVLDACF